MVKLAQPEDVLALLLAGADKTGGHTVKHQFQFSFLQSIVAHKY